MKDRENNVIQSANSPRKKKAQYMLSSIGTNTTKTLF